MQQPHTFSRRRFRGPLQLLKKPLAPSALSSGKLPAPVRQLSSAPVKDRRSGRHLTASFQSPAERVAQPALLAEKRMMLPGKTRSPSLAVESQSLAELASPIVAHHTQWPALRALRRNCLSRFPVQFHGTHLLEKDIVESVVALHTPLDRSHIRLAQLQCTG